MLRQSYTQLANLPTRFVQRRAAILCVPSSFPRRRPICATACCALLLSATPAAAQTETQKFAVQRYEVKGNTLLASALIDETLRPYTGQSREYGDLQRALEALELLYRKAGYSAVQVYVPEQELTGGTIRLEVTEARLSAITIVGAEHFDEQNIRNSVPALRAGVSPNATDISANVQLANENPAKQIEVVLRAGEAEGEVNSDVRVTDAPPSKWFVTADNTGNEQTGNWRTGIGFQHANLFNRDHVVTLNYSTSPEKSGDVAIMSASYRLPLYTQGHSIDVIVAKSDVNAGTTATVAGPLSFSGKGDIAAVRYNWLLPRRGVYTHRVIFGADYKAFRNSCTLGSFGAAGCGSAGVDITDRPVSASYAGQWTEPRSSTDFSVGYARNIPGIGNGRGSDFAAARPSPIGQGGADSRFSIVRATASHIRALEGDVQIRFAAVGQYTRDALIAPEQLGIAGSTSVRGFLEREVARDVGYFINVEVYTPDWAAASGLPGNLRGVGFYDRGTARNNALPGETAQQETIASIGAGLRWNLQRNATVRFDVARVMQGSLTRPADRYRGHVNVYFAF